MTKSKQVRAQSYYKYPMEIVQKSEESHLNDLVPEVLTVKAALVSLMLCCVTVTTYEGLIRLRPADRSLALVLLTIFLSGAAMAWAELRKWWKTRTERFGEQPLANLLKFVPSPKKLLGRFGTSAPGLNQSTKSIEIVEPTKAA